MKSPKIYGFAFIVLFMSMLFTACGSKDSTSTDTPSTSAVDTTTISGSIYAAPVANASVIVTDDSGSTLAGPVTTLSDGSYSINIPTSALANTIRFESDGGTFDDEASEVNTPAGKLSAIVEGGALTTGSAVHLDPSSTIVHDMVTSGSGTSLSNAKAAFNALFGFTPDTSLQPLNTAPTGTMNQPHRLRALRAAAFSQMAKDLGLTPGQQFDLLKAIGLDFADDGVLNGSGPAVNGISVPEDIQTRFESALVTFMTNTTRNHTGLTPDQIGDLPFGKVAVTNSYIVKYLPGMMKPAQGKTMFAIQLINRSDKTPATGKTITLMPMMHMSAMKHASPVDVVVEDTANPGTYKCTVYYLMASGAGMGYWDLKVKIGGSGGMGMGGETAVFFPTVGMAMGTNTVRATLKGDNDIISNMTGTEKRSYYLFNDGLSGMAGSYTFKLFIAAKENMAMSYPALSVGTVLSNGTGTVAVTTMNVQASSDGGLNWITASDDTKGHWSIPGITNLVSGSTGTVFVKMNVNGEDKTTDGLVSSASGTKGYATFVIKPGM